MDLSKEAIWTLAIGGSAIGVLGGVIGTWATIHAAKGPNERRLAYQFAAFGVVYMIVMIGWFILMPRPYELAMHAVNFCFIMLIPKANERFQKAREADQALGMTESSEQSLDV